MSDRVYPLARLERAGGVTRLGPASVRRHRSFHVLRVAGGPYEMGFQHGALLRAEIAEGPLPLFARYVSLLLQRALPAPIARAASALLCTLTPRIIRRLPHHHRATVAGLADGSGIPQAELLRAYVMPEVMLAAMAAYGRLGRAPPAPPLFGCSSAVAGPGATAGGRLLHARNFDFVGVGRWDRQQVVSFLQPRRGHASVSVCAAGVVAGGITGMNAAGVTCTIHQHFTGRFDFDRGTPVGVMGDEVMRHADSVASAVEVLDRLCPIAAWTFVLTDPRRAAAYEVAPGYRRVTWMSDDLLGYANTFLHPDMAPVELDVYPSYRRANHARHRRLWALLRAGAGAHTEASVAAILADHVDPGLGTATAIGDTIRTPYTVGSVIFRPADRRLWVGCGPAPTASGPFVGFDLDQRGPSDEETLPAIDHRDDDEGRALAAYRTAYRVWLERGDVEAVRGLLAQAVAWAPLEARYRHMAGLVELRALSAESAERHFRVALAIRQLPEREARSWLGLAWALDLAGGQRTEARSAYRRVLAMSGDPLPRRAARRGRLRPFSHAAAGRLQIELIYSDVTA